MDLESHYCSSSCEFNSPGLQRFIERYRKTVEHEHKHSIEAHTVQLQGVNQMQAMQSRQVMMMKHRNVANILDVMGLTYNVCCFPGRLVNIEICGVRYCYVRGVELVWGICYCLSLLWCWLLV